MVYKVETDHGTLLCKLLACTTNHNIDVITN